MKLALGSVGVEVAEGKDSDRERAERRCVCREGFLRCRVYTWRAYTGASESVFSPPRQGRQGSRERPAGHTGHGW